MDKQKNALNELVEKENDIEIPNTLDQYILGGIQKRTLEEKRKAHVKWIASAVACFLLIVMITSIRVSPTLADYISGLPGGKFFVELVHFDKGLQEAIEHDYAIPIMKSDEQHGLEFTIEGMTIDEARMVLFYSVKNNGNITMATIDRIYLLNENKESLESIGISYGSFHDNLNQKKQKDYGKIDVNFTEQTVIPNELTIDVQFLLRGLERTERTDDTKWSITIPIDKDTFVGLKQEYSVNQDVIFAGQNISILKATIYPTRMALHLKFDENNEYRIFTFEDLALVNEKGERWTTSSNGLIASHISDYERILYLDSSYFHKSEELYLEASQVRALPEAQRKVVVDLVDGVLTKAPKGLHLKELTTTNTSHSFTFELELDEQYDDALHSYGVLSSMVYNLEGEEIEFINSMGSSNPDGTFIEFSFNIPKQKESQIVFEISDYSTRLLDQLRVKIK